MPYDLWIFTVLDPPRHDNTNTETSINHSPHLQPIHHQSYLPYSETFQHNGRPSVPKNRPPLPKRWSKTHPHLSHNLNPPTIIPVPRNPVPLQTTTRNRALCRNNSFDNLPRPRRRPTFRHWNHFSRIRNIPRASSAEGRSRDIAYGCFCFLRQEV